MDARYKTINLFRSMSDDDRTIPATLARLKSSPYAQRRVRILNVAPDVMARHLDPRRSQSHQEWTVRTTILRLFRQHNALWNTKFAESITQAIGCMVNVEELVISSGVWFNPISDMCVRSFFQISMSAVRAAFGSTLRSLTLDLSLKTCSYALMRPSPTFPSLERLRIAFTFREFDRSIEALSSLLCDVLVPFINDHHPTIEDLNMTFTTYRRCDVTPHLRRIRHLPRLRKLSLNFDLINVNKTGNSGLRHTLRTHSDELRQLCLNFPLPHPRTSADISISQWILQDIGDVPLPQLELLDLWTGCGNGLQPAAFLSQFRRSLTTLLLNHIELSYYDVETIVNVLAGYERLRALHISVIRLEPVLFDLFFTKLTTLDFLHVRFRRLYTPNIQLPPDTTEVKKEMRGRLYRDYNLRHLDLRLASPTISVCELCFCKAAIRSALPDLKMLSVLPLGSWEDIWGDEKDSG